MKAGKYEVYYENLEDATARDIIINVPDEYNKNDLSDYIRNHIPNFDKFLDIPFKYIKEPHPNRIIAILNMDDEYEINELLNNGYHIEKYHEHRIVLLKNEII